MIVSFPVSASGTDPDTGASRMPAPRSRAADSNPRITDGGTVLMSTRTDPADAPSSSPSGPAQTSSTAGPSASMVMAMSDAAAAAAGVSTTRAWS